MEKEKRWFSLARQIVSLGETYMEYKFAELEKNKKPLIECDCGGNVAPPTAIATEENKNSDISACENPPQTKQSPQQLENVEEKKEILAEEAPAILPETKIEEKNIVGSLSREEMKTILTENSVEFKPTTRTPTLEKMVKETLDFKASIIADGRADTSGITPRLMVPPHTQKDVKDNFSKAIKRIDSKVIIEERKNLTGKEMVSYTTEEIRIALSKFSAVFKTASDAAEGHLLIMNRFGGPKLSQIPIEKYPLVMNAIEVATRRELAAQAIPNKGSVGKAKVLVASPSIEEVKTALYSLRKILGEKVGGGMIKDIVTSYGVKMLSNIPPLKFPEILARVNEQLDKVKPGNV